MAPFVDQVLDNLVKFIVGEEYMLCSSLIDSGSLDTSLNKVDAYHLKATTRLTDYTSLKGHSHFLRDASLEQDKCDRQFAVYSQ